MADPYRISDASEKPEAAGGGGGVLRPVLWLVLAISLAANVLTSSIGENVLIGSVFGACALASGITLIVHHYKHRRR
ncbi:hypothetical protein [Actinomadura rugatobispora]|uniref:Uncharacterized protein n=1 Tax=Actinomadura rugatobispora TaxID=1994 RepID=A0ABW0ZQA8_9ACTN|nr:hypothetical protein GCM10010200_023790 [Actinomadura rugatobispora]